MLGGDFESSLGCSTYHKVGIHFSFQSTNQPTNQSITQSINKYIGVRQKVDRELATQSAASFESRDPTNSFRWDCDNDRERGERKGIEMSRYGTGQRQGGCINYAY